MDFESTESPSESWTEDDVVDGEIENDGEIPRSSSESSDSSESCETTNRQKSRASTSKQTHKKQKKKRKVSKNTLSEEEVEELCERLESKRQKLDDEIMRKFESSVNLAFYPFIDEFIQVIHDVYNTRMTAKYRKAAFAHSWSKKLRLFLSNETWKQFCGELSRKSKIEISHVDK